MSKEMKKIMMKMKKIIMEQMGKCGSTRYIVTEKHTCVAKYPKIG